MPATDLLSLVFSLRPLSQPDAQAPLPTWWGRAAHALLLNTVRQYDDKLAEKLHEDQGPRPFTTSTLIGRYPAGRFDMDRPYTLRLTAFQLELAAILLEAVNAGSLSSGSVVELDYHKFRIEYVQPGLPEASPDSPSAVSPWASTTSFQELSAPYLLAKTPAPRHISLQFTSPTTFKSGGMHVPLPLPDLVFNSLLERWNAFAPIAFPPETRRYAAECLAVGRYKLSSRAAPMKSGGLRVGAIGEISYSSLNYDRYWMSVIAVLAGFALFSGVGAGTGMGLGQSRQITTPVGRGD